MPKISWKKWRVGLWLAILLALCSGGAGLIAGMDWRAFIAVTCASLVTHITAYLQKSPLEDVEDQTETNNQITK